MVMARPLTVDLTGSLTSTRDVSTLLAVYSEVPKKGLAVAEGE